jgi:curved DNA-binding protein CbpA
MPESARNYYQVLQVSPTASRDEIRKAYHRMAMRFHPDRNPGIPPGEFAAIQEAYALLSDPAKRAEYDYQQYLFTGTTVIQKPEAASPAEVLSVWRQLNQDWKYPDPFRLNKNMLYFQLRDFLSVNNTSLLRQLHPKDPALLSCIHGLLHLTSFLEPASYWQITRRMREWLSDQPALCLLISKHQQSAKWLFFWEKYKTWIALGITAIFCALLVVYGQKSM